MHNNQQIIFDGHSIHSVMQHNIQKCVDEVNAMSENEVLSRTTDDIVAGYIERYLVEVPELHEDQIYTEQQEVTHKFDDDDYGRRITRVQTAHYVEFHIPFTGDSNIFILSPSNHRVFGREICVTKSEIVITLPMQGTNADGLKNSLKELLGAIREALAQAQKDFSPFYRMIENAVRPRVDKRRADSLASKSLVADLGFPMRRRSDAPTTYKAPEVRRKITPVRRPAPVAPFKPEPTLEEADYKHILGIMDNMTTVMERSPHVFVKMGEEDIRQHFLVQLNSQYEGQAAGETFNTAGKTDILIRSDGKNIFIAECKFWHGEKGFVETVDQLLSYVTWRDTKTAVVIFNKNKNMTGVIETIKKAMDSYPHKKRGPMVESETHLRYILGHPNDHNREIITTVMVYDIPQAA
jgi:hypothetical protein